jgi:uncharacterized membrane protein
MDAIMNLLKEFDPAALLPDISSIVGIMQVFARILILIIPLLLGGLGAAYYFKPIKEANHIFGYRTYFGMGSVEAWKYTQRLAGFGYMALGGALTLAMIIVNLCLIGAETLTLLTTAAICLVIELVLTGLGVLALNIFLAIRYDRDGYLREER